MRKLLLACAAAMLVPAISWAADLPVKAPPPAPYVPPAFSWTGFYFGGNIGGAWSNDGGFTDRLFGLNFNRNNNGEFMGGGQIGANYQFNGNFVLGFEWDGDWLANNNNGGVAVFVPTVGTVAITGNDRWVSTLAARLGWAFDHWLWYAKVGGGWVGANNFTLTNLNTGVSINTLNGGTTSGWLAGFGVEWAFTQNWTAKLEYDYLGASGRSFTVPLGFPILAGDTFTSGNHNLQMVKFGVNYLFNWGQTPVVSRY